MPTPLTPSSDEAAEWAREELSRAVYSTEPTLWQIILREIWGFLERLLGHGESLQSIVMPIVLVAVTLSFLVIALIWGRNLRRGTRETAQPSGTIWDENDERDAAAIRAAAHDAAAQGDYPLAVIEAFRALVREATERGVVHTKTGTTAVEAVGLLRHHYPERGQRLEEAARLFNGTLFGTQQRNEREFRALIELDDELRRAEPARGASR